MDVANAMNESQTRKARLATALKSSTPVSAGPAVSTHMTARELAHLERHLAPHGLSITILLRSVAKHFHGVDVPVYTDESED